MKMKAARLQTQGLADAISYEDVSVPAISDGQVLVRVISTSVNQIDWKLGSGKMGRRMEYPWIPGMDFSGIIEKTGASVTQLRPGDPVVGCSDGGSYAEYIAADQAKTVLKPNSISYNDATGAAYVAQTAWQSLYDHGQLQSGQRVLIHGAAGAVGAYAVQFSHLTGAYVYATASGSDRSFVAGLGADSVIDYKNEDFAQVAGDLDLVLDLVGGDTQSRSYPLLKPGGRLVSTVGKVDEQLAAQDRVQAVAMGVKPVAADLEKIMRLVEQGNVKADIAEIFKLEDARKAWEYVLSKNPDKRHGKVVISVAETE